MTNDQKARLRAFALDLAEVCRKHDGEINTFTPDGSIKLYLAGRTQFEVGNDFNERFLEARLRGLEPHDEAPEGSKEKVSENADA